MQKYGKKHGWTIMTIYNQKWLTSGPGLLVEDPELGVPCKGVCRETGDLIVGQIKDM